MRQNGARDRGAREVVRRRDPPGREDLPERLPRHAPRRPQGGDPGRAAGGPWAQPPRAPGRVPAVRPDTVLRLQRRIGNARTAALLGRPAAAPAVQRTLRPTLRWGSEGTDVVVLQEALNRKARVLPLKESGVFDHATRAAVVALQQHHLIDVDGVAGPQTWEALGVEGAQPVLRAGDGGPAVAALQRGLNGQAVELFLDPDGRYGPLTYAVARAFQQRQGLAAHGTIGESTWRALDVAAEDSDKLAQPDIAATEKAAAKYLLSQLDAANDRSSLDAGVWYAGEYYHRTQETPETAALWRDEYLEGYANPAFFERRGLHGLDAQAGAERGRGDPGLAGRSDHRRVPHHDRRRAVGDAARDARRSDL